MRETDELIREMREREAKAAEQARKACARMMRKYNYDKVRVWFDGSGDSGSIDRMEVTLMDQTELLDAIPSEAEDAFEDAVYSALPGGWEINDGSSGEVVIRRDGRISGRIGWNTMSVEYEDINGGLPGEDQQ